MAGSVVPTHGHSPGVRGQGTSASDVSDPNRRVQSTKVHQKVDEADHSGRQANQTAANRSHLDGHPMAEITPSTPDLVDFAYWYGLTPVGEYKGDNVAAELDFPSRAAVLPNSDQPTSTPPGTDDD